MKLRIEPTIYNSYRTRKQTLKEVRKPIQNSLRKERTKKKLFKVKRIHNSDLYGDSNTPGEHLVLTIAINPNNDDVATTTINSLEDAQGNPTKQEQIRKGFIMPLPQGKTHNFSRKVGIRQEVITKNVTTGNNLNHSMLLEPLHSAKIDEDLRDDINSFLFENPNHKKSSSKNHHKVKDYVKIK